MAFTTNKEVWKILAAAFIVLTVLFGLFFYFNRISIVMVTGVVLIILTEKMSANYHQRMKEYHLAPWIRTILGYVFLIFWVVIGYMVLNASFQDLNDAVGILNQGDTEPTALKYFKQVQPYLPEIISQQINILTVRDTQASAISGLTAAVSQISFFFFYGFLIIPLMFYTYFKRRHAIMKRVSSIIPEKFHRGFINASRSIGKELHDYLEGRIVESIVVGVICCFGFFIIGLKGWLFLGLLAGFLNMVPLIGPILGAIPPIIVSLADEPWVGIAVLVTIGIAQLVDNFYLIPFMISGKVRLDPLLVIILILVGAQLLGIMGVIFAIPVFLIYKIVLQQAYSELIKIYK